MPGGWSSMLDSPPIQSEEYYLGIYNHRNMAFPGEFSNTSQPDNVFGASNQSETTAVCNGPVLTQLNDKMVVTLIPVIVYLAALMIVGTVGNFLTIYIFGWKLEPTTQNSLFMWLGVFDMVSCVTGMPSEIVDVTRYYVYDDFVACKIMRFTLAIPTSASIILLIVIAVDRYRRVCRPLHWQMELAHVKVFVWVAGIVAVLVAIPALVLYGTRTIKTSVEGLQGCDCSVQDVYQGRLFPLLYEMMFGVAFVCFTITLVVLYARVWLQIRWHRKYMRSHAMVAITRSNLLAADGESNSSGQDVEERTNTRRSNGQLKETTAKIRKSLTANKLTLIGVGVTVLFVVSYLPHLSLMLLRTVIADFDHNQTGAGLVFYNIFLRSYFFNSVGNVFVYSAMNDHFRLHCRRLWTCSWKERQAVEVRQVEESPV